MGATCMLPACFLRASFYTTTAGAGLTSTSFPSKLNWTETHTIWSTFLGSTQEAHMGATCVLPSVASLTGRAVQIRSLRSDKIRRIKLNQVWCKS